MTDFFRRTLTYDEAPKGTKNEDWVPGETEEAIRAAIARVNGDTTMDEQQVERVAEAIANATNCQQGGPVPWDDETPEDRWAYRERARAAIAALRDEPPLETLFDEADVQRVVLYRIRQTRPYRWSAYVQMGHVGPDDPQGVDVSEQVDTAIRAAVENAKGQGDE